MTDTSTAAIEANTPDDIIAFIVMNLRVIGKPWHDVDVDVRNEMTSEWRRRLNLLSALQPRPVEDDSEVENIRREWAAYVRNHAGQPYQRDMPAHAVSRLLAEYDRLIQHKVPAEHIVAVDDLAKPEHALTQQQVDAAVAMICDDSFGDGPSEPWKRDNEATLCLLLLLGDTSGIPIDSMSAAIAKWTDEQCQRAEEWAGAIHLRASDNDDVAVPPRPLCVDDLIHDSKPAEPPAEAMPEITDCNPLCAEYPTCACGMPF